MRISSIFLCISVLFIIIGCSKNVEELKQNNSLENQQTEQLQEIEKIDFSRCTKEISHPQTRNHCIISYFVPRLKNIAICNQMFELDYNAEYKYALYDKFTCYSEVASETENLSICEQITLVDKKSRCIKRIEDWKTGVSVCDDLEHYGYPQVSQENIYYCYTSFAVHTSDVSLCDKIPDMWDEQYKQYNQPQPKIHCFEDLAVKLKDASICRKLKDGETCYRLVARETKDSSLCNNIVKNEYMKQSCLEESGI